MEEALSYLLSLISYLQITLLDKKEKKKRNTVLESAHTDTENELLYVLVVIFSSFFFFVYFFIMFQNLMKSMFLNVVNDSFCLKKKKTKKMIKE